MHRIRPILKNLSKRSNIYWTRLEEVIEEGYKKFLSSKSIDRVNFKLTKDEKLEKEEYSKVKATIREMLM